MSTLSKLYTKSRRMRSLLSNFISLCKSQHITVLPVYLDSLSNAVADMLSRSFESHGSTLSDSILSDVHACLPHFTRFSVTTYSLPPLPNRAILAVPPWHLLPQYLHLLISRRHPSATLLPLWPHQVWWPLLRYQDRSNIPPTILLQPVKSTPYQNGRWGATLLLWGFEPTAHLIRRLNNRGWSPTD